MLHRLSHLLIAGNLLANIVKISYRNLQKYVDVAKNKSKDTSVMVRNLKWKFFLLNIFIITGVPLAGHRNGS